MLESAKRMTKASGMKVRAAESRTHARDLIKKFSATLTTAAVRRSKQAG